jgi:hypothetical protein
VSGLNGSASALAVTVITGRAAAALADSDINGRGMMGFGGLVSAVVDVFLIGANGELLPHMLAAFEASVPLSVPWGGGDCEQPRLFAPTNLSRTCVPADQNHAPTLPPPTHIHRDPTGTPPRTDHPGPRPTATDSTLSPLHPCARLTDVT